MRFTPRKPGSVWSESNVARVARMIAEGRMTPAGMALVEEAKRRGTWDQATSGRLDVTPPDLEAALAGVPAAAARWEEWPASPRRQYVYWVLDAKRPETRARRIADVVRRAAAGLRPGENASRSGAAGAQSPRCARTAATSSGSTSPPGPRRKTSATCESASRSGLTSITTAPASRAIIGMAAAG